MNFRVYLPINFRRLYQHKSIYKSSQKCHPPEAASLRESEMAFWVQLVYLLTCVFDLPKCPPGISAIIRAFPVPIELTIFDVVPDHSLFIFLAADNGIARQDHFPI